MNNQDGNDTLADWGEFRLLNELVLPLFGTMLGNSGLDYPMGDDCTFMPLPDQRNSLVLTSDAGPRPLAWSLLDSHTKYHSWGWYSVLVNLSDLAAAGAQALAVISSVEAPSDMRISDFKSFFLGMANACARFDVANAGGNLRAAPRFECHPAAVGLVPTGEFLKRSGCEPGDTIAVIGNSGYFITAYLKALQHGVQSLSYQELTSLLYPTPKLKEMSTLREAGVLRAATDNSDGILGALYNLAESSNCAIEVKMHNEAISEEVIDAAGVYGLDPWNLMFCWGDWQVVVAVKKEKLSRFRTLVAHERIPTWELGQAVAGPPGLFARCKDQRRRLNVLRNENFVARSFNDDSSDHLMYMLRSPLFSVGDSGTDCTSEHVDLDLAAHG